MHAENDRGHGRDERRTIKVVTLAEGRLFPHAAQAICITCRIRQAGTKRWKTITVYAVTGLAVHEATPAQIAGWSRWSIEASTTSVTSVSAKTLPRSGPETVPASWPRSETS
ncbi:MAG TPA: hypothetical protein VGD71_34730 [Kribbella sp.]|jgi:hypothetical protein